MDFNPEKIPCKKCICLAICKGQDVNDLLNKCPNLKTYMETDLDHFKYVLDFFESETKFWNGWSW
jgi:hypothetical protein